MKTHNITIALKNLADQLLNDIWGEEFDLGKRLMTLMGSAERSEWHKQNRHIIYAYIIQYPYQLNKLKILDDNFAAQIRYSAFQDAVKAYELLVMITTLQRLRFSYIGSLGELCVALLEILDRLEDDSFLRPLKYKPANLRG